MEPGDKVPAGRNLEIQSFKVEHSGLCLGYRMVETRSKLKAELTRKTNREISNIAREHGSSAVRDSYCKTVLAHCGDSAPVRPSSVAGADVLIHEATFLDVSERRGKKHSSAYEAIDAAREAGVGALILIHTSGRYQHREIRDGIKDAICRIGWDKPLAVLIGSEFVEIQ